MAMNLLRVDFYVLDVGQGACNYVELIDLAGNVAYNLLLDLGTNSSFAVATSNIAWLQGRIAARPGPMKLDVLVLTHGDTDHFNMVSRILPAFGPPTQQNIGMVRYGGPVKRYTTYGRSLIDKLKLYSSNVAPFGVPSSSYNAFSRTWTPIWPAAPYDGTDAKLFIIMANTPHAQDHTLDLADRKRHDPVAVNAKSVVFGLWWNDRLLVGTGDATAATFSAVNGYIPPMPSPTAMLTMPHHGSRNTTFDLANAQLIPGPTAINVVKNFLGRFNPATISISADEKGHHHPSLATIDLFSTYTASSVYWSDPNLTNNRHYLTAWVDWNIAQPGLPPVPSTWAYATLQTSTNLYCTLYYSAAQLAPYQSPPIPAFTPIAAAPTASPRGMNWLFRIEQSQALTVLAYNNLRPNSTRLASFAASAPAIAPARNAAARSAALRGEPKPSGFVPARLRRTTPPTARGPAAPRPVGRGPKPLA